MRYLSVFLAAPIGAFFLSIGSCLADDADFCARASSPAGIAACDRVITAGKLTGKDLASIHYNRGLALLERGEHGRAIADFDDAIRLDPLSARAFNNRGSAWYAKGDLDRALADFTRALALDPSYALAFNNHGEIRREKGELRQAIADYSEAIRLDPAYTAAYANRGLAYERLGDFEQARSDFAAALAPPAKYADGKAAQETARTRLAVLATLPAGASRPGTGIGTVNSAAPAQVHEALGRRVALVIGNSAYESVPMLANPKHDAQALAESLRGAGFETVMLAQDVTREQLVKALDAFARQSQDADWAMVYFAGHGIELAGVNYLIPVDARLESDRDVAFQAVALEQVRMAVAGTRKLRLIVLDACRANPFLPRMRLTATRAISRGLRPPPPAPGTLIVYAAKDGEVAIDGDGGNSPFAAALAMRLATPGLEINRLFRLVRDDVLAATGGRQEPFTYGSLPASEDYYFVAK
jgi:tetratricopeptide (TPR) repeat protein